MLTDISSRMKVLCVLFATLVGWTLVQLCASQADCSESTRLSGDDQVQVEINCTVFSNGTLSTSWNVIDTVHVESIFMEYNCTVFGGEQADSLYEWIMASSGEITTTVLQAVNATHPVSSPTIKPTCYVDGCYEWNSPKAYPTVMIPTVTCSSPSQSSRHTSTLYPVISTESQSSSHTGSLHPVMSTPSQSSRHTSTPREVTSSIAMTSNYVDFTSAQEDSGGPGLQLYILPVAISVAVLAVPCLVLFISILIIKKRRRRWWRYDSKDLLVGNEPSIDPYNRVKNEYYDTMTIVDPLEHGSVPRMEDTSVAYGGTPFLYSLNQQAGDSDNQSSSESGSTSERSNTPMESGTNKGDGSDQSACVQMVESTNMNRQQSDSDEERPCESNTASTKPAAKETSRIMTPQTHNTSTASNSVLPYPNETSPPHTRPRLGRLATLQQDDASIVCQQHVCNSNNSSSPDYVPSSEYTASSGNGTSSVVSSSDVEEVETGDIMLEEDTGPTSHDNATNNQSTCLNSDNGQGLAHQTPEDSPNSLAASDDTPLLLTSKHGGAADRSALKLPLLGGSGMSVSSSRNHQVDGAKAFSHGSVQKRFQDHYVSSSEYTSSEYSNGQSRTGNSIVGYLADIEDVENSSLQSDLESDNDTRDGECGTSHDRKHNSRNVDEHNYDAGDIVELNICLSNKLPQRVVTRHRRHIIPLEDDDGLYYAMHDKVSLPESPCSGYIDMGLLSMPRNQEEEVIYEDMSRQNEHAPIEDHDYVEVSSLPQNRQKKQYKYETTV